MKCLFAMSSFGIVASDWHLHEDVYMHAETGTFLSGWSKIYNGQ